MSAARVTESIPEAAAALAAGGLVALPTETVYGLGARVDRPEALARVFSVKGRPADHPLILHLDSLTRLDQWAVDVPEWARLLAAAVWPGPLTLILRRSAAVPDAVTGGQDTVGLRVPDHPVALALLAAAGTAVAAPSANRFGSVSPTTAAHVASDLGPFLDPARDLILDGGPCAVGVESTIVLATASAPRVLRPGALSELDIAGITGLDVLPPDDSVRAPGTLAAHYAPRARVRVVDRADAAAAGVGVGLLAPADLPTPQGVVRLAAPGSAADYARVLYAALRESDDLGLTEVFAVPPDDESAGSESAGSESAGSESAGSESAGSESAGSESAGVVGAGGLAHAVLDRLHRAAASSP